MGSLNISWLFVLVKQSWFASSNVPFIMLCNHLQLLKTARLMKMKLNGTQGIAYCQSDVQPLFGAYVVSV